jgi:hypothetical protein
MAFINHSERPKRDLHARHRSTTLNAAVAVALVAAAPAVEEPAPKIPDVPYLKFKGNIYGIGKLQAQAGTKISFERAELHDDFQRLVEITSDIPTVVEEIEPIFAKWEGKYVVLLGLKKALEQFQAGGKMSGKLLANPVLKHARLG